MRLCNPDVLIEWQEVVPPKFKKDYEGKLVRVKEFNHYGVEGVDMPLDGGVCRITRRHNDTGAGADFSLDLEWRCPACNKPHTQYIRESWITEGRAAFVEPVALADYVHCLEGDPAPLLFVAVPLHPDNIKFCAYAHLASQCAVWLGRSNYRVFSPASLLMALYYENNNEVRNLESEVDTSLRLLEVCDALCVLLLEHMRESVFINMCIDRARALGLPCNQIKLGEEDGTFSIVTEPKWWR